MKILSALITSCVVAFSYYEMAMWKYVLATLTLLLYFRYFHQNYKQKLGLNLKLEQIPFALLIAIVVSVLVEFLCQNFAFKNGVTKTNVMLNSFWFLQPLSQSLNEEMLFRAGAFYLLQKYSELMQNLILTFVFSLGHLIFCYFMFGISLNIWVMFSFLAATFAMNLIYFRYKNIFYTWALHFGVNFSLFGGKYLAGERVLNDAEKFNLVLGQPLFALVSLFFLMGTCTHIWGKKNDEK